MAFMAAQITSISDRLSVIEEILRGADGKGGLVTEVAVINTRLLAVEKALEKIASEKPPNGKLSNSVLQMALAIILQIIINGAVYAYVYFMLVGAR